MMPSSLSRLMRLWTVPTVVLQRSAMVLKLVCASPWRIFRMLRSMSSMPAAWGPHSSIKTSRSKLSQQEQEGEVDDEEEHNHDFQNEVPTAVAFFGRQLVQAVEHAQLLVDRLAPSGEVELLLRGRVHARQ